jgi:hypothetical protein
LGATSAWSIGTRQDCGRELFSCEGENERSKTYSSSDAETGENTTDDESRNVA